MEPSTQTSHSNDGPHVLKMLLVLTLLLGAWAGTESLFRHFFLPDPPALPFPVTNEEILAGERRGAGDVDSFLRQKAAGMPYRDQVTVGLAPGMVDQSDRAMLQHHLDVLDQLDQRFTNARLLFAMLVMGALSYWVGAGIWGAFFMIPLVGWAVWLRVVWRLASLPDRYWERVPAKHTVSANVV